MNYEKELMVAKRIAKESGKTILEYFDFGNKEQGVEYKEDASPVTKADVLINDFIIEELQKEFPEDGIIGEERSTSTYGMGRKWICDPIDGTAAFTWGMPIAMFSLALVIDGRPVLGVAYDAFLDKMYVGVRGEGSFCNEVRLKVSDGGLDGGKVAVTSNPYRIKKLDYVAKFEETGTQLRTLNGAVYKSCLVAKGKFEGYVEHMVGPHDLAAMQVVVEEAGGKMTAIDGSELDYTKPFKGAIASNGKVHEEMVKMVNG